VFVRKHRILKISASQLISNMICTNHDHNKKFGLLKFHSGYRNINLDSPEGYGLKKITRRLTTTQSVALIRHLLVFSKMIVA